MNTALTLEWLFGGFGLVATALAMRIDSSPYLVILIAFGAINLALALHDTQHYLDSR